ncbi:Crp/Fnr family transcriptional regulator [Tenacibaculum agarivorans]|uniref:Crp/Fnr family transcriptional regulator n=1 Tax=Tenacibaculum agarivorans TaxID=1908389 RepID=UPI00094B92ED|nr:Crp/Fnr family transcriptional regulator [Tenacibaculum agarivorans]
MKEKFRKHIEKIISLTDQEYEYIYSHFATRKINRKDFLVERDKYVENVYWVVEGLFEASYVDQNGKRNIIQFAMDDWWITDYNAFFNKTRASIDVTCIATSTVLSLSLSNREKICFESHKMANFFRIKSNLSNVASQKRILNLLSSNAQERYEEFISKYPELIQKLSKKSIASYLGVSRETLSRLNSSRK